MSKGGARSCEPCWVRGVEIPVKKQLFRAVQHCHTHGIGHRDIEAENIFIATGGVLKLGDFGQSERLQPVKQGPYSRKGMSFNRSSRITGRSS